MDNATFRPFKSKTVLRPSVIRMLIELIFFSLDAT